MFTAAQSDPTEETRLTKALRQKRHQSLKIIKREEEEEEELCGTWLELRSECQLSCFFISSWTFSPLLLLFPGFLFFFFSFRHKTNMRGLNEEPAQCSGEVKSLGVKKQELWSFCQNRRSSVDAGERCDLRQQAFSSSARRRPDYTADYSLSTPFMTREQPKKKTTSAKVCT